MSKSILIIDTPSECNQYCPCFDVESGKYCNAKYSDEPCPLKPLPEKKPIVEQKSRKKMKANLRAEGWNACIDEILKERDTV